MDFWTYIENSRGKMGIAELKIRMLDNKLREQDLPEYQEYQQYLKSPDYQAYLIHTGQKVGNPTGLVQADPEENQIQYANYQANGGRLSYTEWAKAGSPTIDKSIPEGEEGTYVEYWDEDGNKHRVDLLTGTDVVVSFDPNKRATRSLPGGVEEVIDGGDGFRYRWNPDTGKHDIPVGSYNPASDPRNPNYRPDFTTGTPLPEGVGGTRWNRGYKEIYDPKANNGKGAWVETGEYDIKQDPQYLMWQRQQEATNSQLQAQLAWQQQQAQMEYEARRREQEADLAAQKQNRLAQLAAQPQAWLQHAALSGQTPSVQPWMLPLMNQEYGITKAGEVLPGWQPPSTESGQPMTSLPELTRPSAQYQARMGSSGYQQYLGYQQARTAATPEDTAFQLWNYAPPTGRNRGLTYVR